MCEEMIKESQKTTLSFLRSERSFLDEKEKRRRRRRRRKKKKKIKQTKKRLFFFRFLFSVVSSSLGSSLFFSFLSIED